MNKKILCVDDEPHILEGFRRNFRRQYDIRIAEGARQALAVMERENDFAAIVTDMRMPEINGVQLLEFVRRTYPDMVRIMLTGDSEQETAMQAVNNGEIFRFLHKPCAPEEFEKAVEAAIYQHNLMMAERELLEKTLSSSLQILIDILALVNPTAFSRAARVRRLTREIAEISETENLWEVEIAAMLSQIGCISVPEEILRKAALGEPLTEGELQLYLQHPQAGCNLIKHIPRMETIAEIIANQNRRTNDVASQDQYISEMARRGASILKIALDFDRALEQENSPHEAFYKMSARAGLYDAEILEDLKTLIDGKFEEYIYDLKLVSELTFGMILCEPIINKDNRTIIESDSEVTFSMLTKLENLGEDELASSAVMVKIPLKRSAAECFEIFSETDVRAMTAV